MMGEENKNLLIDFEELKALNRELHITQRELKLATSRNRWRKLKRHIDELKIDMGWALLDCKEYEKGLALLSSVSWRNYGEVKCNGMVRALTEMGYYDEARKLLAAGLRRFPKSYALWVAMGGLYESLGDDFEALRCMDTALQFAPGDNSTGLYNKFLILTKLGCYGDAVQIIEGLIERYPENHQYLADRGSCALDMGYPQEALGYYQKAMKLWQHSQGVHEGICIYSGLCSAYFELGMKREAMEIAFEGLKKFPDEDPILYQNVGATFSQMGWDGMG
jgi:tetratricopeptide (TPR) repeat protein